MPTTLITNAEGNGVGVVGRMLAKHISGITAVIAIRCNPEDRREIRAWPVARSCSLYLPPAQHTANHAFNACVNDKYLYIEETCGLGSYIPAGAKRIFIPMWEQVSLAEELRWATLSVAVSWHTRKVLHEDHDLESVFLRWPVVVPPTYRVITRAKTILHNAGGLGANFRKGTDLAIFMFQRSGVAARGVRFVVRAAVPPPPVLAAIIAEAPDGITWETEFRETLDEVYADADLVLHPSRIDGSPLIAAEAAARGVPALVTAASPMDELSPSNFQIPVTCFEASSLTAPYAIADVETGAEMLTRACERDLSEDSRETRALAERELSWEVLGPRWEEICA